MVVRELYISAEEFLEICQRPENEGKRLELVNGVIVEDMAGGASGRHGIIAGNFFAYIFQHSRELNLGRVLAAETGFTLLKNPTGKDIVRCPDVGFISYERAPEPFGNGFVPFAPDLAVEVISPGNTAEEIYEKVRDFLRYGTRMVIVAYPETTSIFVHTPKGSQMLEAEDTFDGSDVLPGFSIQVKEFFTL